MSAATASEHTPLLDASLPEPQVPRIDEETGPSNAPSNEESTELEEAPPDFSVIAVLLLGVFVGNVDSTLVMAQTGAISSEFDDLSKAEWLVVAFFLASCSAQPILGKLSDIYGRKPMLLTAYAFFTIGNFITGAGQTMWMLLFGRAVAGIGGGAMLSLVSILISDLVPVRSIATWRSYVNVAATTGRSLGGPIGGLMTDTVGWRWSMYGQCPLTIMALLLVAFKLRARDEKLALFSSEQSRESHMEKLRRIDFLGAIVLVISTLTFLLGLEIASKGQWVSTLTVALWSASAATVVIFVIVESRLAKEPIFPVRLMCHRDVITSYLIGTFQMFAQVQLMFAVPLYFQITMTASATDAGSRLVPAVVGNAVGGLLSGAIIKKTGRYKLLTLGGVAFGCLGYGLTILRWHGHTSWAESLYIFPGGFATGVVQSTMFIALTAGVSREDYAAAGSGFYQATGIGGSMATCVTMAILQATLRPALRIALSAKDGKDEIITRAIQDIHYVQSLKGSLRKVVVDCYVWALSWTHVSSLACSGVAFIVALFMKERLI